MLDIIEDCSKGILDVSPKIVHFIRTQARANSGLTIAQFRVLAFLSHGSKTNADLADRQGISAPTMSRIIEGLVRKGYVSRMRENQKDRRQVELCLTQQGREVFDKIITQVQAEIEEKVRVFSEQERIQIREGMLLLGKVFV
jgi:DNA-binding MarR family transcriptional regulator